MAIYDFGGSAQTANLRALFALDSSLSAAKTAAGTIDLMTVNGQNDNNDMDTQFTKLFPAINAVITAPGTGASGSPLKYLFFVSDGVADEYKHLLSQAQIGVSSLHVADQSGALHRRSKIATSRSRCCTPPISHLPTNDWYNTWIKPFNTGPVRPRLGEQPDREEDGRVRVAGLLLRGHPEPGHLGGDERAVPEGHLRRPHQQLSRASPLPASGKRRQRSSPLRLRPVVAVDRDIFLGEIAGQHAVAALAETERDLDLDLRVLHRRGYFRLVVGRIARAALGDADAVERDRQLVAVGGLAGLADRHHHAAPIGVLAGDRGLHQRRIRHRHRDFSRGLLRRGALDDDLDQLARALAVAGDLLGKIGQHRAERLCKCLQARVVGPADLRRAAGGCSAGGEGEQRVRRRGVAVDGDGIEGVLDAALQQRLQRAGAERRVGEHEGQHGRHVRRDHAGALGHAVDGDFCLAKLHGRGRNLRKGVGGHDRRGGVHPVAGLRGLRQRRPARRRISSHRAARRSRRWRPEKLHWRCIRPPWRQSRRSARSTAVRSCR